MKNNILKSIFVTILLLLGASHAAWGEASYSLAGTIPGCDWGDNVTFNGNTNTVTITLDGTNGSSSQTYEFKVKGIGSWDNSWGLDNGEISTSGSLNLVKDKGNVKFHPNGAGDYEFKWDPTTTTITITYPSASGGGSTCTLSAAPTEVIAGTNVMFYVQSYSGNNVTIGTSGKDVKAATYTNVVDGISYINIAKTSLTDNTYITNNPGNWNGVSNDGIASAKGGEYFVGNSSVSTTAAKTATTTTTINGNTLNISTTANSAKGVYNDLQLYIQYYIDATFAGVTYSEEEATYCSIKASTSAVLSTYDISYLSTGEHTLLTVLTDGNIYYIADTDNFSVGSSYTVTIETNDADYGSVSPTEVANVASGTSISASANELTIGNTTVIATPTAQTDQYTYSFNEWTEIPNGNEVTENITVTANFSRANRTYTITYNLNSGAWNGNEGATSYTYGTGLTLPTNIQRAGYTFGGWYTTSDFSGNAVTSISDTQKGNITLYAKWTKDYSKDTYYYFDERVTGWNPTQEKPKPGEAMINANNYAFIQRPAYNNKDNKFKIFPTNPKGDDNTKIANDKNIAKGNLKGDIELGDGDTEWHNILMPSTDKDYFVILYYPYTTINPSNNFLVAASYSLPNAETYNVSFGVVDNTGGTLTAKSGSSTIESGALVSFATFTATPAAGYAVEGWYADAEGNTKITAAGTNTTYSQAITGANNTVYVKFAKTYAIYYKFNDQKWNDNYYAYIFTDEVWHSDNGVRPKVNRSEFGKMSKYNDSVYYYKFTKSADYPRFAFSWGDHSNADYFNNIDAVYRSDFHKDMPVFIAERGQSPSVTKGKYYNKGVWMKFNDTDPGYNLCLTTDNGSTWNEKYRFTAAKAGDYISTVNVELTKGVTYKFWVKNDKAYYFKTEEGTCTSDNHKFTFYVYDDGGSPITIAPEVTGTYTFQLNLANGKVEIDVLYPTTSYRLVYVEKNGGTIEKFHPSHIIKSHPEATKEAPMFDTVSMHVRPKMLKWNEETNKYDTTENNSTCEVWLQEFKKKEDGNGMDWETIQTIDTKTYLTTNGVYNFIIAQGAKKTSIDPVTIDPYRGRYYIRTDASDGGWANFKQFSNLCYYTDYSRVYRGFDYYYCHWAPKANIKYTIACDYSYCVSDTLAQEDHTPHNTYTDANGTLQHNANVRFMWNSFDNTLDRAYIAGAGDNLHLLSASGIYDTEGIENTIVSLLDQENWVYRADVKADTQARIRLRAMPYNGATTYSWFRGKEGEITDKNNTEQLIEGKAGTQYTIRVIYDFKTDHLICAWIPDGNVILDTIVVNADLMLLRENHREAAQLKFSTNGGQLKDITVAYSVINITKAHLSDEEKKLREKEIYWISFPYDVNLSDVFGCGKYGEHFIIQYYDGAARAENGCWADSPTYWKYITNPTGVVLKKGLGYVLVLDSEKILEDQFKYNNASVNIYFPSSGPIDSIDAKLPTAVEVPEHECTIKRDNRDIYDSNWNIIGIPTWANIDEFNNPMKPEQSGDYKIGFYYAHDAKNSKWTVCETSTVDFQSMYSYLVQWAGTINWQEKSATGELHPSSLAPRRYAPAAEGDGEDTAPEQYTLCLTLNRGGQQLDQTYVRLQEGNVTTDFDLNYDMTKILNSGANLYSLVGTNLIQCAANVQPLQEEARTISIPLGVVADQDGLYTFSLPEGTEGMNVSLTDSEDGTAHNLALGDYQTALSKGTYEGRFALEIRPRQEVTTGCEQTDAAGKHLRKVLIDGNLYILRDGKAYTAAGQEL